MAGITMKPLVVLLWAVVAVSSILAAMILGPGLNWLSMHTEIITVKEPELGIIEPESRVGGNRMKPIVLKEVELGEVVSNH